MGQIHHGYGNGVNAKQLGQVPKSHVFRDVPKWNLISNQLFKSQNLGNLAWAGRSKVVLLLLGQTMAPLDELHILSLGLFVNQGQKLQAGHVGVVQNLGRIVLKEFSPNLNHNVRSKLRRKMLLPPRMAPEPKLTKVEPSQPKHCQQP